MVNGCDSQDCLPGIGVARRIVTQAKYARRIDVTRPMICKYIEMGMPTVASGNIDPEAADAWREANIKTKAGDTLNDARQRKEIALAALREIELLKAQNEVVEIKIIKNNLFEIFRQFRDSLLTIPERLSAPLALEGDQRNIHRLLLSEITERLDEFATAIESK